jgi:hypothetical protein
LKVSSKRSPGFGKEGNEILREEVVLGVYVKLDDVGHDWHRTFKSMDNLSRGKDGLCVTCFMRRKHIPCSKCEGENTTTNIWIAKYE